METLRTILADLNLRPARRLGQNFLTDRNWIHNITSGVPADLPVVEIGPGTGNLTEPLLDRGHPVFGIEIDFRLCDYLETRFADRDFHLLRGDAVEHPLAGFDGRGRPFALVSNLPFAITSPWLDALLRPNRPLPDPLMLILQKEGYERTTAASGDKAYGPTAIRMALAFHPAQSRPIPPRAFHPPPGVESCFAVWRPLAKPVLFDTPSVRILRDIFGQRRKMLRHTLKSFPPEIRDNWSKVLATHGLDETARPADLPPEAWAQALHHRT